MTTEGKPHISAPSIWEVFNSRSLEIQQNNSASLRYEQLQRVIEPDPDIRQANKRSVENLVEYPGHYSFFNATAKIEKPEHYNYIQIKIRSISDKVARYGDLAIPVFFKTNQGLSLTLINYFLVDLDSGSGIRIDELEEYTSRLREPVNVFDITIPEFKPVQLLDNEDRGTIQTINNSNLFAFRTNPE